MTAASISLWGLAASGLLVVAALAISAWRRLGLSRQIVWAAARALVQLLAVGGALELVILQKQDAGRALAHVGRLFDGTLESMPGLISRSFRRLVVQREKAAAIQVDGELQESGAQVVVTLHPSRLQVLVPAREGEPGQ